VSCLCPVLPVWSALTRALGGTRCPRSRWCASGVMEQLPHAWPMAGSPVKRARKPGTRTGTAHKPAGRQAAACMLRAEAASSSSNALPGRTLLVATGFLGYADRST